MQLLVVPGDEYVGSIEPDSLQVLVREALSSTSCDHGPTLIILQTYCKLARVPVEVHTACLPWKSPSCKCIHWPTFELWSVLLSLGKFPVLKRGDKKVVSRSADDIIASIKDCVGC